MNRAARRAHAATTSHRPAYGRPADLFRQLAALGVAAKIVRTPGHVRLDYRVAVGLEDRVRAVQSAFPSDPEWECECVATLLLVAGEPIETVPPRSERVVELAPVLAAPPRDAVARRLLVIGVRQ